MKKTQKMTKLLVDAGAFSPSEHNASLRYNTSYVEYILLLSAPGIKIGPTATPSSKRRNSFSLKKDPSPSPSLGNSGSLTPRRSKSKGKGGGAHSRASSLSSLGDIRASLKRSQSVHDTSDSRRTTRRRGSVGRGREGPSVLTHGEVPVIIPTHCVNEILKKKRLIVACGQPKERVMKFDRNLGQQIRLVCGYLRTLKPKTGKGLTVKHFHEALALGSTVISQQNNVKVEYIRRCMESGVKYIDTEVSPFCFLRLFRTPFWKNTERISRVLLQ